MGVDAVAFLNRSQGTAIAQGGSGQRHAASFPSAPQGTVKSHERPEFVQICLCQIELCGEISRVAIEYLQVARGPAFVSHIRQLGRFFG